MNPVVTKQSDASTATSGQRVLNAASLPISAPPLFQTTVTTIIDCCGRNLPLSSAHVRLVNADNPFEPDKRETG